MLRLALRYAALAVLTPIAYAWRGLVFDMSYLRMLISNIIRYLSAAISGMALPVGLVLALVGSGVLQALGTLGMGVITVLSLLGLAACAIARAAGMAFRLLGIGVWTIAQGTGLALPYLYRPVVLLLRLMGLGLSTMGIGVWTIAQGTGLVLPYLFRPVVLLLRLMGLGFSNMGIGVWSIAQSAGLALPYLYRPVLLVLRLMGLGLSTIALLLAATCREVMGAMAFAARGTCRSAAFAGRTVWTGFGTVPDVGKTAVWIARHRKGMYAMSDFSLTRQRVLSLIATLWLFAIVGSILAWTLWPAPPEPTVRVVHWATGHLMREGEGLRLLPVMAEQFNEAGHRTQSDVRIVVEVHNVPSELQAEYLVTRATSGGRIDLHRITDGYVDKSTLESDPAIVTSSSAHWLVTANYEVDRDLVNLSAARSIVAPVIGIVTYEEMARCLGWPEKEIGYADIIALRNDPDGWESYDCADGTWGRTPLVAFTDPTTSSTGRSLHLALYSFAAGKPPEQLTPKDVNGEKVVSYVKRFQGLIDHYLIGTTVLNTKIHQGPRYGHFFIMPEDNLIHLYEGTERAFIGGVKKTAPKISERMVMIYPKEGSMPRNNCACIVQAAWVTGDQVEAAERWIDYLLEDEQQRSFMAAGFRPATDLPLADPISATYGLDPTKPKKVLNPSLIKPEVAAAIDDSWELVKRPGIVTFVVDTSGSMVGDKLRQAKDGLDRALGNMARNNQVGLVTFSDEVNARIPVAPLAQNRFTIADTVHEMRAGGETALYDAILAGIEMTDEAEGAVAAIRAVVVLTDGRANRGQARMDDLIKMWSNKEKLIEEFDGFEDDQRAVDVDGTSVEKATIRGEELLVETRHPIQIFYIGIGDNADMEVGRILAEATGAEFQGVTEDDLANVLEEFSKYF